MDDGFCDFAFGFAQNDRGRGEACCEEWKFWIRESNRKEICFYVD